MKFYTVKSIVFLIPCLSIISLGCTRVLTTTIIPKQQGVILKQFPSFLKGNFWASSPGNDVFFELTKPSKYKLKINMREIIPIDSFIHGIIKYDSDVVFKKVIGDNVFVKRKNGKIILNTRTEIRHKYTLGSLEPVLNIDLKNEKLIYLTEKGVRKTQFKSFKNLYFLNIKDGKYWLTVLFKKTQNGFSAFTFSSGNIKKQIIFKETPGECIISPNDSELAKLINNPKSFDEIKSIKTVQYSRYKIYFFAFGLFLSFLPIIFMIKLDTIK